MNVTNGMKRGLKACILLMMTVLACTIWFAVTVKAWEPDGSYSLIIKKEFDFNSIPNDVQEQAKDITYTFKIEGTRKVRSSDNGWKDVRVEETVTLPREENGQKVWESKIYKSEGPFRVTVTEITDNIDIEDENGEHYNMSGSSTDASVQVNSRKYEVRLRNNSTITISRPALNNGQVDSGKVWYHVTSRAYDEHATSNFEALDSVFALAAGEEKKITSLPSGENLCAGVYMIEQIAAPDGYQIQMGKREENVAAGNTGHFYINGTPGKLTLTAGGTKGDGVTHYFTINRTEKDSEDSSEFVSREISVSSKEDYVLDNLPKGGYTVTEYSVTEDANTQFSVTMSQTDQRTRSAYSSAPRYSGNGGFRTFSLSPGTTYIKLDSFGPLCDENRNPINDNTIKYDFDYGWGNDKGGVTFSTVSGEFGATSTYTLNNPSKRYPDPKSLIIGFRINKVISSAAKYLGVSWTEYTEKDVTKTFDKAGIRYTSGLTVDDRGCMTITAPAPKIGNSQKIVYYYTVQNNRNVLIPGPDGATDREDTTVMLRAGGSVTMTGLKAGSYKITENVDWAPVGFAMKVEGAPFGTTEAGKLICVKVGGQRDLTISKPAFTPLPGTCKHDLPEEAVNQEYTFEVNQIRGSNWQGTVKVKAGESQIITLPAEGEYQIVPVGDSLETYHLKYTDSGAVYGTAEGSTSEVIFKNAFAAGDYGYRYIHEYYVKEEDGTYTYEGNSQITTRLGRNEGDRYQALDISQAPDFQGNHYKHFDEAYGWVDGISKKEEGKAKLDDKVLVKFEEKVSTGSNAEKDKEFEEKVSTDSNAERDKESDDKEAEPAKEESGSSEKETGSDVGVQEEETLEEESSEEETPEEEANGAENYLEVFSAMSFNDRLFRFVISDTADKEEEGTSEEETTSRLTDKEEEEISEEESASTATSEEEEISEEESTSTAASEEEEISEEESTSTATSEEEEISEEESTSTAVSEEEEMPEEESSRAEDRVEEANTAIPAVIDEENGSEGMDFLKIFPAMSDKDRSSRGITKDDNGIIMEGNGVGSNEEPLNYGVEDGKDYVDVTEDASQIIILRYYRDRQPKGSYNVIHVYYFRDGNGDHWEGTSGILPQEGELGVKYVGEGVEKVTSPTNFDVNGKKYTYTYDGRPQYGVIEKNDKEGEYKPDGNEYAGEGWIYRPNNAWTAAEGTEDGNQIIILRYYREVGGSYNIVHEYYFREAAIDHDGDTGSSEDAGEEKVTPEGEENVSSSDGGSSDVFAGTLEPQDGFSYTFVGRTDMESVIAGLNSIHTAEEEEHKLMYKGEQYEYINAGYGTTMDYSSYSCESNKQWAVSTESGDDVIILRYFRDTLEGPPKEPENPPDGPGGSSDDPGDPPKERKDPPEKVKDPPELSDPNVPSYPTELPDPNDPNSPDRITIMKDGVPLTYVRVWDPVTKQWIYILESEIPMYGLPKVGDDSTLALWVLLFAGALGGAVAVGSMSIREKEEE